MFGLSGNRAWVPVEDLQGLSQDFLGTDTRLQPKSLNFSALHPNSFKLPVPALHGMVHEVGNVALAKREH